METPIQQNHNNMETILNAYFKRIGYNKSRAATLETLVSLHRLHPQTIAFENLNPLLRIPVPLDIESLEQKLLHNARGGYCFEQNLMFQHVLKILGFEVKGLAARIRWNIPEGQITSRGHMLLLVTIDGKRYIADVGFGGLGPTAPLLLEPDKVQETPHENYRLILESGEYVLQSNIKEEWKSLYQFNLNEHYLEDYEVTNWYLSNNPTSHFLNGLFAARPDSDKRCRYTLRNNELSIHDMGRDTEKHVLKSVEELRDVLNDLFFITLPDIPDQDDFMRKLISQHESPQ